ncbi:DUF4381 domain-containing protein [Vibrio sp. 10N.261.55.A7]|uniref:DUF4381 domain-containing protein n=1 Tax=Vibrio sp. 10N.261.55.A7 TaxID=1880851 RepID=UPI000C84EBC6|nr:DUF4381 domain-containing protein [Vibrio sp. 10N.261.55.A7]PMK03391.1 hypothetical protein BCU12_17270 [Vibrio sp. 10N.261.55.A7]
MTDSTNSALLALNEMKLPPLPSWFPMAWGWWATVLGVLFVIVFILAIAKWNKKRLAPKKTALKLLQPGLHNESPSAAIEIMRQAALSYFPRERIAHLTGGEWYAFLDSQLDAPLFVDNASKWQQALYKKNTVEDPQVLIEHCYQWVNEALPPKRGRKLG